jgi:hypothetical protein
MALNTLQQSILNKSRVDKFKLVFQLPNALKEIDKKLERGNFVVNQDSVQFSVYGSVVPRITVPAIEIRYGGSTLYNTSHSKNSYPPVTVNFKIDNQYNNYWTVYQWLNLLHDQTTGLFDANDLIEDDVFKDYQTDITIYGLNEFDKETIAFKYTKAFPTDLTEINFNYRDGGEIESGFTFVYSQLHISVLNP